MAGFLRLTDGTITVDLYDTNVLHLSQDGWRPVLARENVAGDDYDDVDEVLVCEWLTTTDDNRDTTLHNLNFLGEKARRNVRQRKLTDPVYIWVSTPSETNRRYGVIKDITVPTLDSRHWGPNQPIQLSIAIKREGAYRDQPPITTPQGYTSLVSGTVTNQVAGANVNYLDVAAADVKGDALALPVVQVAGMSAAQSQVLVALRSRQSAADITAFNPHFNAVNFGDATYVITDASAPGGKKWSHTSVTPTNVSNYVALPSGLSVYSGSYLVFAVCLVNTASVSLAIGHSVSTTFADNANPAVPVPVTTNYMPLYLGRISLPPSGRILGVNNPTNYYLNLKATYSSGATFQLRNIYIVPVDDGIFSLESPAQYFFIDSTQERSWNVDGVSNRYTGKPATGRGRYLRLRPAYNHRIMFFYNQSDASGGVNPAHTATVTIRGVMRYLALRGNT